MSLTSGAQTACLGEINLRDSCVTAGLPDGQAGYVSRLASESRALVLAAIVVGLKSGEAVQMAAMSI